MRSGPLRTCLGCRQAKPQASLVRLVRGPGGTVTVDADRRGTGRGAYVCAKAGCLERALERGRLSHAFRKPCQAGASLAEEVRGLWQRQR